MPSDLALFAPAFSLAPLFAMINNVFEIRIDAVKFCVRDVKQTTAGVAG